MIKKIKINKIEILRKNLRNCKNCFLGEIRRKNCFPVIGKGSIPANILFINEFPNKNEELINTIFMGNIGKFFNEMFQDLLKNDYTYFITNSIFCRPIDIKLGESRKPKPIEIIKCKDNILKVYNIIKPNIVIFIGKNVEENYKRVFRNSITILHPNYLLRGGGKNHPNYLTEIQKIKDILK